MFPRTIVGMLLKTPLQKSRKEIQREQSLVDWTLSPLLFPSCIILTTNAFIKAWGALGIAMYFVYIIETEDGTYYTGMTNDLARRMSEHLANSSRSATYLRFHRPKFVVYTKECETRSEAMRLERKFKDDYRFKMECIGSRRDIREVVESELSYK